MLEKVWLRSVIKQFEKEYRGREAFVIFDGNEVRSIRYIEFAQDIRKAAGYFKKAGIKKEHVALLSENSYEWYVAFLGILASGNVAVLMNQDLPEEELIKQCSMADVSRVFSEVELEGYPFVRWSELKDALPICPDEIEDWDAERLVCLLFTSGTLGSSKAIMLTADNLRTGMDNIVEQFHIYKTMQILPLYHISGVRNSLAALVYGNTVCIGRGIKYLFQDLPRLNPNHLSMVPGIAESLVKILKRTSSDEKRKMYIGRNLKCLGVGGAASREDMCRYLMEQGFELGTGYGLTETTGCGMTGLLTEDNMHTIGRLEEGMKCRIEDGEILLSGRAVMAGYYKDPESTGQAIRDGWLHTGDLGYQAEDGQYYLTGRKKNVIILSNGENVSPEEIEAKLGCCREILECMVYGDVKGICADIYTQDREKVQNYVLEYNQSVPTYRQLYKVHYFDSPLEKTGSGKIKRKENMYE